jgi:hypothetical protein
MTAEFKAHKKIKLREAGRDEKWLQSQIAENPAILGLGELTLFRKELKQGSGGRLDMLLTDPETEIMYEIEMMLGATDPSHIIRTIEYWDIESRHYPNREHRAVIVAEEITNRFFNVIWLLNRSLPLIAIKLDVLDVGGDFLLHFTKVLDIYEAPEVGDEQASFASSRQDWERYSPAAMKQFDRFMKMLSDHSLHPTLNYERNGIALAGKWNIARIIPRKSGVCLFAVRSGLPEEIRIESRNKLENAGVEVNARSGERFSVRLDDQNLKLGGEILADLVRRGIETEG